MDNGGKTTTFILCVVTKCIVFLLQMYAGFNNLNVAYLIKTDSIHGVIIAMVIIINSSRLPTN